METIKNLLNCESRQKNFAQCMNPIQMNNYVDNQNWSNKVRSMLPATFKCEITKIFQIDDGNVDSFLAHFICDLRNGQQIDKFIKDYQELTSDTLRSAKGDYSSKFVFLSRRFRCQHNTRQTKLYEAGTKRIKNTNCPFHLTLKIYHTDAIIDRAANSSIPPEISETYPCEIILNYDHSHQVNNNLQMLSFRDMGVDSIDKIMKLFSEKYTPSQARRKFQADLRELYGVDDMSYHLACADRARMPRVYDFNNLYRVYNEQVFGGKNGPHVFIRLREIAQEYNLKNETKDGKIMFEAYQEGEYVKLIVVIVTPLMSRVHKYIKHAGEIVFSDCTSNVDEHNLKLFLLVTHSVAGGLPLAIMIMTDEQNSTFINALSLLKKCLPQHAFFNRGVHIGPRLFITDHCDEERGAISHVWPEASLLLCIFHFLQAEWRWVNDKNNAIDKDDRQYIIKKIKEIVYEKDVDSVQLLCDSFLTDCTVRKYEHFISYFKAKVWPLREVWCLAYRRELPVRQNHTQNFAESQFLVFKQEFLQRVKSYNIIELMEVILGEMEQHYKDKLQCVAAGTYDGHFNNRFKKPKHYKEIPSSHITVFNELHSIYLIKSFTDDECLYSVDLDAGYCSCPDGSNGTACKHQFAVAKFFNKASDNLLPFFSHEQRQMFALIAHGAALPDKYYADFVKVSDNEPCCSSSIANRANPIINQHIQMLHSDNGSLDRSQENIPDVTITVNEIDVKKVEESLDKTFYLLKASLPYADSQLLSGLQKFTSRVCNYSIGQLTSALHCFGSKHLKYGALLTTRVSSAKRRFRKNAISVQPESVKRRKSTSKSRKALLTNKYSAFNIQNKTKLKQKRPHKFSHIVEKNLPVSRKSGRSMFSKTRIGKI